MKKYIFPVAFLFASTCFATLQISGSSQTVLKTALRQPRYSPTTVPESCPVTTPSVRSFVPPTPYPNEVSPSGFWFGTEKLWTYLPRSGEWKGLGHYTPSDTAFRQKLLWYREGYRKDEPASLTLIGKRLDEPAPLMETYGANAGWTNDSNHPFIVVGMDIPTLGCWKFTGKFEDATVSFTIWITQ